MQCKKLIRCNNVREEHASYCVSHKTAHEPKRYCDSVIHGTHQCSNYARKGDKKCASHGEKRFKLTVSAYVCESRSFPFPIHGYSQTPATRRAAREGLETLWAEWRIKNADTFHPISEKFYWKKGYSYGGQRPPMTPTFEVNVTKAEARVPEWKKPYEVDVDGTTYIVKVEARGE